MLVWLTVAVLPHRRVGVCAARVLAATLTLTAVGRVSPVGAQAASPDDVADRLVQSVAGYVALPEADRGGMTSGPATWAELAGIVGAEFPDSAVGSAAGYMRVFRTPAGDGVAMAMGFDVGIREAADFMVGFDDAVAAEVSAIPLFPGEQPPLGEAVAYEFPEPGGSRAAVVTALASSSLVVILAASDPNDNVAVLRQLLRDQAALTPPSMVVVDVDPASPDSPRADGDRTVAYKVGRVAGLLVLLGVAVGLVRAVRRGLPGSPSSSSPPPPPPPSSPPPPPPRPRP